MFWAVNLSNYKYVFLSNDLPYIPDFITIYQRIVDYHYYIIVVVEQQND